MKQKRSLFCSVFTNKLLKKPFNLLGVAVFLFFFSTLFFLSKGTAPSVSELAFIEHSSLGQDAGSVVPASCDSANPFSSPYLAYNSSTGIWESATAGSHFNGDCTTLCPDAVNSYDPYYDPGKTACPGGSAVNGVCSGTAETCSAGTYSNSPADTGTNYQWTCLGSGGGSNSGTCTAAIGCVANIGAGCQPANVCGEKNSPGTVLCNGSCSVPAPGLTEKSRQTLPCTAWDDPFADPDPICMGGTTADVVQFCTTQWLSWEYQNNNCFIDVCPGPLPCDVNQGNACPATNACITNWGTIQCDGSCNAAWPFDVSSCNFCGATHNNCNYGYSAGNGNYNNGSYFPSEDVTKYYWDCGTEYYDDYYGTTDFNIQNSCTEAKAATTVNGACSATAETCTAGTYSNVPADTGTDYRWTCLGGGIPVGSNSGTCTAPIPVATVNGACSATAETCTAGLYSDSPADTVLLYQWTCLGEGTPPGSNSGTCTAAKISTYKIVASAGLGGSIAPNGTSNGIASGSNRTFTITANPGYDIAAVFIDSFDIGAAGSYTFSNITSDHEISVSFSAVAATVNGVCSVTAETCTTGTYSNAPADTGTDYRWTCLGGGIPVGSNSGTCTAPIPATTVNGACSATAETCTAGTYSNAPAHTGTDYRWTCLGGGIPVGSNSGTCTAVKAALHICPLSATVGEGFTQSLFAWYTSDGTSFNGCLSPNGSDVSNLGGTSWSSSNAAIASVNGSGLVTGVSVGSTAVQATYSGVTDAAPVDVTCTPTVFCSDAAVQDQTNNTCIGTDYSVPGGDGCGAPLACPGQRACDFNWKEVAP